MLTWVLRAVLAVLLIGALLVGSILLIEPRLDLTPYRTWIAERLAASSGRDMRIGGDIHITLGRHTQLSLRDIEIANPDWADRGPLLRAGEVDGAIDLVALLSGVIRLDGIRLRDASASLEVSAQGARSWQFGAPPAGAAPTDDRPAPTVVIEDVLLENVALAYHDPAAPRPLLLRLERVRQRNDRGMLVLDGAGELNGLALQFSGHLGTLGALMSGRDIDIDISASLDDTLLTAQGQLGRPAELEDIALDATLRGPGLTPLLAAFGVDYPHRGDIDASLQISDLPRGFAWTASGHVGGLKLTTKGSVGRPRELDDLEMEVDLHGSDLKALGELLGTGPLPRQPYRLSGTILRKAPAIHFDAIRFDSGDAHITLQGQLPAFPHVDRAEAHLQVNIPQARLIAGLAGRDVAGLAPLEVTASLTPVDDGREILEAALRLGGHRATLEGPVGGYPDYGGTRLAFAQSGPDVGSLATAVGIAGLPNEPYRLAGSLAIDRTGVASLHLPEGVVGPLTITSSGVLGHLPDLAGIDLQLRISGPSLHRLTTRPLHERLPDLPFDIDTRLRGEGSALGLVDTVATLGDARLTTQGRLGLSPSLAGSDARFTLHVPQLAHLLPATGRVDWAGGRYRASGQLRSTTDGLELLDTEIVADRFNATASGRLPASLALDGATLAVEANIADLAAVVPPMPGYRLPAAPLRADLQLRGRRAILDVEKLELELAEARLTGKGQVALAAAAGPARFSIEAQVPRLSDLGSFDAIELADDPLQLQATLTHAAPTTRLEGLSIRIGDGEASGTITVQQRTRPLADIDLALRGIDFRRLFTVRRSAQPAAATKSAADAANGSTEQPPPASAPAMLVPDGGPQLDFLFAVDGSLRVHGDALHYPDPKFAERNLVESLAIEARLRNGNLLLSEFSANGERGRVTFSGRLDYLPQELVLHGRLHAEELRGGILASGKSLDELPKHVVDIELSTQGRSYRQLVAALHGSLHMTGGPGRTSNTGLETTMGSFLAQLFSQVNPFSKSEPFTRVDCSAAAASIEDGRLLLAPGLVIRTDKIDVSAHGTIDLASEKIDIQFKNAPREGIGLSAAGLVRPFVKVGGTLSDPGIALDTTGALLSGTAAIATSGLSLVATSLLDRFSTAANPCARVVAEAEAGNTGKQTGPLRALERLLRGGRSQQREEETEPVAGPH